MNKVFDGINKMGLGRARNPKSLILNQQSFQSLVNLIKNQCYFAAKIVHKRESNI
jgi:hypothetical protein